MSPFDTDEAVRRTMDRLFATAWEGVAAPAKDETIIVVPGRTGPVSVRLRLADIEAVQIELGLGAPCGICHHNPCTFRDRADA